jgi:competence ComEA-like helix-hairpin-helix protein
MFSLTPQERQVILFLTTIALVGIGADFLLKKYSPLKTIASISCDIGKVNLNTADKGLLMDIPGIGEKLAQRIIEYREKQTTFCSIEELKNIKGITDYKYEKIKDSFMAR